MPPALGLAGILGHAYLDLEPWVDVAAFPAVHEEICWALAELPGSYTGGAHRSMGIMPPGHEHEALGDYGETLRAMTREERLAFARLADDWGEFDPETYEPGEEGTHQLSRRQLALLKVRYGVYFPWQVFHELIPNRYWDEKSRGAGKDFTREARAFFPKTIALVRSLPFVEIGRCNVMGLDPLHHGTLHRDGDPRAKPEPDHFVTLCPGANKRLFVLDAATDRRVVVTARAAWFNDSDWHGVEAAPHFRYSVRVDGVFRPEFVAELRQVYGGGAT